MYVLSCSVFMCYLWHPTKECTVQQVQRNYPFALSISTSQDDHFEEMACLLHKTISVGKKLFLWAYGQSFPHILHTTHFLLNFVFNNTTLTFQQGLPWWTAVILRQHPPTWSRQHHVGIVALLFMYFVKNPKFRGQSGDKHMKNTWMNSLIFHSKLKAISYRFPFIAHLGGTPITH